MKQPMKSRQKAKRHAKQTRREFLGGVLAGSAASALLAVTAVAETSLDTEAPADAMEQKPKGYHVTPHIRTYYQKAQI